MNNDRLIEMLREEAERKKKEDAEKAANPLLEYSTTQLKKELRRRKRGL